MVRTGESGTGWALLTEERLIARARGGDQPAFAELVRRHGASAWYLALVVTGSPAAATEAAGRGLLRTMATLDPGRWTSSEPYRAWLLRSVHAAATGARPGSAPDLIDLTDRLDEGTGYVPGQAAMAYASLPEKQRAALWMAEVEALSVDEVARGLDLEALDAARTLERGRVGFAASVGSWRDEQHFAHLPGALASSALPVPSTLEDDALGRWRTWSRCSARPRQPATSSRRSVRLAWSEVRDDGLGACVAAAAAIVVFLLGVVGAALVGSQGQETTDTPVAVQAGPETTAADVATSRHHRRRGRDRHHQGGRESSRSRRRHLRRSERPGTRRPRAPPGPATSREPPPGHHGPAAHRRPAGSAPAADPPPRGPPPDHHRPTTRPPPRPPSPPPRRPSRRRPPPRPSRRPPPTDPTLPVTSP